MAEQRYEVWKIKIKSGQKIGRLEFESLSKVAANQAAEDRIQTLTTEDKKKYSFQVYAGTYAYRVLSGS
jgi:hypothetical protein